MKVMETSAGVKFLQMYKHSGVKTERKMESPNSQCCEHMKPQMKTEQMAGTSGISEEAQSHSHKTHESMVRKEANIVLAKHYQASAERQPGRH